MKSFVIVFGLGFLGLIPGFITLNATGQKTEQILWLLVFLFSAIVIFLSSKTRFFLQGFIVGVLNCTWVTIVHILYYARYITSHPEIDNMNKGFPPGYNVYIILIMLEFTKAILLATISGFFSLILCNGLKNVIRR